MPLQPELRPPAAGGDALPRILMVEDDEDDHALTRELLLEIFGTALELEWVRSWEEGLATVGEARHDVYLVDYRLGDRNGLQLVGEAIDRGSAAPFIVLTGQGSREIDLDAMRAGASDYLVKSEMTAPLLDRAIRYAIERHRAERRLAELAQFDQLTGLANRVLFRDYLLKTMSRAERQRQLVAVMLLDLDRFKTVNDTYGHEAGDLLLRQIAQRLKASVRESDLVARLGGDEFVVVMDSVSDPGAIAGFANRLLDVVRQPTWLGGCEVVISASIRISVYPTDVDGIDDLLASADAAMYRAKEQGADRFHFYTMAMRVRAAHRLEVENGLRGAVARREFRLHYQPQVALRTGAILGMEALLRWQHPERGLVAPGDFVPLAEETGLIVPIGAWVLQTARRQLRQWHQAGHPALRGAVNFSARQFQDEELAEVVAATLRRCDLAPSFLEIEITESDILKSPGRVQSLLAEFAELGIRIALDDFGTGYSSLNHLRSFPGASIKIDRSFIRNVCNERHDAAIVRSLIVMAHSLDLTVIAEGVETAEQLAFLHDNQCDTIQGFFVGRPIPVEEISPEMLAQPLLPHLRQRSLTA
jgi:diguanylate cyclase (GGDEF)-like protein